MSDRVTWRRVRAGEYESEAGRTEYTPVDRFSGEPWWYVATGPGHTIYGRAKRLRDAKAACERAYFEARGARG